MNNKKNLNNYKKEIEKADHSLTFSTLKASSSGDKNPEVWLTTPEAAHILRVSPKQLRNLCNQGVIPFYKLGRCNRYLGSELQKVIFNHRRGGYQ